MHDIRPGLWLLGSQLLLLLLQFQSLPLLYVHLTSGSVDLQVCSQVEHTYMQSEWCQTRWVRTGYVTACQCN